MQLGKTFGVKAAWNSLTSGQKRIIVIIIAAALVFRLGMASVSDNFNHPDENFQVMEQAHRLVFGYGFMPWEYRYDARSWIVPGIMSLFLFPFKWLGIDRPDIYVPAVRAMMGLVSLVFVLAAFYIAARLHSIKAGLWAALISAVWYEMIYFAVRPLSEVWGALFLISGLMLIVSPPTSRRLFWGVFLTGLGMAVRINYIPLGLVALGLFVPWRDKKTALTAVLSISTLVIAVGVFETITAGKPFQSYINFYEADRFFFMKDTVGRSISWDYLLYLGFASLFLFWIAWPAGLTKWRHTGKLAVLCLVAILTHILIPAKAHQIDYRHVFVVIPLTLTMGGILLAGLFKSQENSKTRVIITGVVVVLIIGISTAGAFSQLPQQKEIYSRKTFEVNGHSMFYNNPRLRAYIYLSGLKNVVGLLDNTDWWFRSGGYYYLHQDIPVYFADTPPRDPAYISHVISKTGAYVPDEFEPVRAFDNIVVYQRRDDNFVYKTDSDFSHNIYQSGIDDNPQLMNLNR